MMKSWCNCIDRPLICIILLVWLIVHWLPIQLLIVLYSPSSILLLLHSWLIWALMDDVDISMRLRLHLHLLLHLPLSALFDTAIHQKPQHYGDKQHPDDNTGNGPSTQSIIVVVAGSIAVAIGAGAVVLRAVPIVVAAVACTIVPVAVAVRAIPHPIICICLFLWLC